jgi:uncharacterized protein (TIGR00661 family)
MNTNPAASTRVLVAPLNWGLGHATRCIPLIRALHSQKAEVYIAASGAALNVLKQEFPNGQFIEFKGYDIRYPLRGGWFSHALIRIPGLLRYFFQEHLQLNRIVKAQQIDVVISDNRYFARSKHCLSICITHQIQLPPVKGRWFLQAINRRLLSRFDEVWVPDVQGPTALSGTLGQAIKLRNTPIKHLGWLSRFSSSQGVSPPLRSDFIAMVSGPEPQRSLFEKQLVETLQHSEKTGTLVLGLPDRDAGEYTIGKHGQIVVVPHLPGDQLESKIKEAKVVICRSGYTSLMELMALNKKAVLIPTPGQAEQVYLGSYVVNHPQFVVVNQVDFQFEKHLNLASQLAQPLNTEQAQLLTDALFTIHSKKRKKTA